ncbi:MAG: hypothetical protein FJW83_06870 [Actinobacteria bacterium]|nr:hypothetical protein [Actinomycetota bacterium]
MSTRRADDEVVLIDLLDGVARSLRSGASFPTAFGESVDGLGDDATTMVRAVAASLQRGDPADEALRQWAASSGAESSTLRFVVAACTLQIRSGGVSAEAVERLAAVVRMRVEAVAAATVEATQARASARVLMVAPLLVSAVLVAGDPDVRTLLFTTPLGWSCLGAAAVLDAAAVLAMRRIVAGVAG